eukprot:5678365-Alexandrium_andersonii.AAC.1
MQQPCDYEGATGGMKRSICHCPTEPTCVDRVAVTNKGERSTTMLQPALNLSLIHISEPTRLALI